MKRYLLSIYQPDGEPPADLLATVMRDLDEVNRELMAAGAWIFSAGLHPPGTATVLRTDRDGIVMTDGPYAEGKEHLGGFTVIAAADLDAALAWGAMLAKATTLPIEVRPMRDERQDG
jgi:hypothetical protein